MIKFKLIGDKMYQSIEYQYENTIISFIYDADSRKLMLKDQNGIFSEHTNVGYMKAVKLSNEFLEGFLNG